MGNVSAVSAPRVVVCGEALVDLVPTGDDTLAPKLGGGPFNVAVTLGRLGTDVAFLSRLSTDVYGERLCERLGESNIDTSLLQRGPEPTTLALTTVDDHGGAQYSFYAGGTADRFVVDPGELPESVLAVSFGTLSLVYEPGASVYESLMRRTHDAGRLVVVDPTIRPDAITDADDYRARFARWLPWIDILKVSIDDADWLGGEPKEWLAAGVGAVLLTRGADGLSLMADGVDVAVPVVPTEVVDTIGAGDTVHGALLHWLDRSNCLHPSAVRNYSAHRWEQALRFAADASAITVSRAGADPPWAKDVEGD